MDKKLNSERSAYKKKCRDILFRTYLQTGEDEIRKHNVIVAVLFGSAFVIAFLEMVIWPGVQQIMGGALMSIPIVIVAATVVYAYVRKKRIVEALLRRPSYIHKQTLTEEEIREQFLQGKVAVFPCEVMPDDEILNMWYHKLELQGLLRTEQLSVYPLSAEVINRVYQKAIREDWCICIPVWEFSYDEEWELEAKGARILSLKE